MRLIKSRAISIATSLAMLAGAAGFGNVASAAAPVISRTITNTDTTATIDWTTDVPTIGNVHYGIADTSEASTTMETTFDTSHTVTLTGLTPSTTYQYEIDVQDASGTPATFGPVAFTTDASSSVGLPVISNITVVPTQTGATVTWTTASPASTQMFYGLTDTYGSTTTLDSTQSTSHTVTVSGLTASTTYHYQLQSTNSAGTATTADRTFDTLSATSSASAPAISNITVNPTSSGATITWNTDSAATGQAFYGLTDAYGSTTTLDTSLSTSHSVTLSGLNASTTYHYQLQSTNAGGTTSSPDRTFDTAAATSSVSLGLTGVTSVNGTALPDGSYANGFKWVLHLTVPDSETSFALKFNDFSSPTASTTIPVAGNLRYFSSQSSNATGEATAITESNNDYGANLNLTGDLSSTTPGRQIDVTVELKVPVGTQAGTYSSIFGARSL